MLDSLDMVIKMLENTALVALESQEEYSRPKRIGDAVSYNLMWIH